VAPVRAGIGALRVLDPFDIGIAQLRQPLGQRREQCLSMLSVALKIPDTKSTFSCDIARSVSR
jgi:hypothetical protein